MQEPLTARTLPAPQRLLDVADPRHVHFVVPADAGDPRDVAEPSPVFLADAASEIGLVRPEPGTKPPERDTEVVERSPVIGIVQPHPRRNGRSQQRQRHPSAPLVHREPKQLISRRRNLFVHQGIIAGRPRPVSRPAAGAGVDSRPVSRPAIAGPGRGRSRPALLVAHPEPEGLPVDHGRLAS